MTKLTLPERRTLVISAIDRIERSNEEFLAVELDVNSTVTRRMDARKAWSLAEKEFSWQRENIKELLKFI